MSFATTYRPTLLDGVFGNKTIKGVIKEIIETGKYAHLLLEGLTGSGKTTLAYIVAYSFGADERNIYDINCIDSGINDLREIFSTINNPTIFGNKKVLILDEIHGVSAQAKSLLLKPMETLSSDVLVIACTTDPQKLPQPLLDRFTYKLKVMPLNNTDAKALVYHVVEQEGFQFPKWKLQLLLEKSSGIPRRLLNGLERIKSLEDENEIKFLLEISEDNISENTLTFFKLLLSYPLMGNKNTHTFWKTVHGKMKSLLKEVSAEEIRVGIASLLMSRIGSEWVEMKDCGQLSELFQIVRTPLVFPEKADLTHRIYLLTSKIME